MTVRWNELNADTQALYPQENLRQRCCVLSLIARTASRLNTASCSSPVKPGLPAQKGRFTRLAGKCAQALWCRSTTVIWI